ncbi:hypothetical protein KI387_022642, partial [Taxus chinensis]
EKKEIGGETIPKRRRSGRRIKTAEPIVPLKETPSSAAATGELIYVSDSDSSPRQEQEVKIRRISRRKPTSEHTEAPQRRRIHKRSREILEEMKEQDKLEKEAADILGSMAMTPPGPSQTEMEKEDERFEEQ